MNKTWIKNVFAFALVISVGVASAATPLAVWDGDFGTATKGGFTLDAKGNSTSSGSLEIDQEVGAVFTGPDSSLNNSTFIIKGEGLDLSASGNQYLLSVHENSLGADASYNKLGCSLQSANAGVKGIWENGCYTTGALVSEALSGAAVTLVVNIRQTEGVFVYEIVEENGLRTLKEVYKSTGLKSSGSNYKGFTVGGVYEKTSSTLVPATGWTIKSLAVFGATLTEEEILAYYFPSDISSDVETEVIGLNFHSGESDNTGSVPEGESAGLVSAAGWNNLTGNSGESSSLQMWDGSKVVSYEKMDLRYSSSLTYGYPDATEPFLKGYLDDGGTGAAISLEGIPFTQYSVIVYSATDSGGLKFTPVKVNGKWYTYSTASASAVEISEDEQGSSTWGATRSLTAVYGTNALRIDGLSGDLTITGGVKRAYAARGGIAAVQIVNTGNFIIDATLDENVSASGIVWSAEPTQESAMIITSTVPVTVTLDKNVAGASLETRGEKITFAGDCALAFGSALVNADMDVSTVDASLGVVTIAEGKTLKGTADATSFTDLSGAGTFEFGASAAGTEYSHAFNALSTANIVWTLGDLVFDAGNDGTGYPKNASLTVSGSDARIVLRTSLDTTGYSGSSAPLTIENGATLLVEKRDTFNRPLVLDNGNVKFTGDDLGSGRSFDLYSNSSIESRGTSFIGGVDSEGESGIIAIRRSDFTFNVVDGTLSCYSQFEVRDGNGGSVIKTGEGTLALYRDSTHNLPISVNAGTLLLSGEGTPSVSSAITVASGATLELGDGATLDNSVVLNGDLKVTSGRGIIYGDISGAGTITIDGDGSVLGSGMASFNDFTGSIVLQNKGAIVLPAGVETNENITFSVETDCMFALRLSHEQMFEGYTAKPPEGVTVRFYSETGTELPAENINGNTYTPTINVWDDGSWQRDLTPGENVLIIVGEEGQTMTHNVEIALGTVKVQGNGSLTIGGGGKITANDLVVESNLTVPVEVISASTAISIAEGCSLNVSSTTTVLNPDDHKNARTELSLPNVTGAGTLRKIGTGSIVIFGSTAPVTAPVLVAEGDVLLCTSHDSAFDITVEDGTFLRLASWGTSFNNADNKITLKGGSGLVLANGSYGATTLAGNITIADASEKAAKIYGSSFNKVTITAGINGSGKLEFAEGEKFKYVDSGETYPCKYAVAVSGAISGAIDVIISDVANEVIFTGANTYTGTTIVSAGSVLKCGGNGYLGTLATVKGTLQLENVALGSKVSGSGTISNSVAGASVTFTGEGAIVPSYDGCMTIGSTLDASVVFDVSSLVEKSDRRFDLIKADTQENLPTKEFVESELKSYNRRILGDWKVVPSRTGIGWALQTKKFCVFVH